MNVWIVDDENEIRQILQYLLEKEGLKTICFENPLAAIEELKTNSPDAIVSDYRMPHMNGLEFYMEIKNKWNGFFVMLTGEPSADVAEFKKCGIKEVLFKPKDLNRLSSILKASQL